ncbi:response regulator [Sphingomonas xinjiangensis]|uniref:DNA-binding response OmpR family regulator n=1 Tax=Sphingomonas xinjiangensis TaxID=643568 RepID=A0A840YTA1_9SPHN|nr:response regulator [Sphingomonas xinjiangensis]MBB5712898.1 DNA-binding response OmpR family regulator [Sphingomonas xinjiangensis]
MALLSEAYLLVGYEPLIGLVAEACLQEHGAEVAWAQTGSRRYTALEEHPSSFHFLISDVNLGVGTTGLDVAHFARLNKSDLSVIYMSDQEPEALLPFAVRGATFVTKTATEHKLVHAVVASLSNLATLSTAAATRSCSS